jgi:hypothetical protein
LALGLSYPSYAKKGGEKADAAGEVSGDASKESDKAGDAAANQGRQNQNVAPIRSPAGTPRSPAGERWQCRLDAEHVLVEALEDANITWSEVTLRQAPMDDKRKDHIYTRAYGLAASGYHVDPRTIISTLKDEGYPEAADVLDDVQIHNDLRRVCRRNWAGLRLVSLSNKQP